jgi:hypothetical protein
VGATPSQVFGPQMHACVQHIYGEANMSKMRRTDSDTPKKHIKKSAKSLGCEFVWWTADPKWRSNFPSYASPAPLNVKNLGRQSPCVVMTHTKSSQQLACELVRTHKLKANEIGIMVAGNSGLPGGQCGHITPHNAPWELDIKEVKPHRTQEESVVANWIRHQVEPLGQRDPHVKAHDKMRDLFSATIAGEWGLLTDKERDYDTFQGINYVSTTNAADYYDCWVVRNAKIGREAYYKDHDEYGYNIEDLAEPIQIGALLFAAAPNANASGKTGGSTKRTLNTRACREYLFFEQALKVSIMAVIDAAIREQMTGNPIKVLILCAMGGGLYWPSKLKEIPGEDFYKRLINQILEMQVDSNSGLVTRRSFFTGVYFAWLPKPKKK